MNITTLPNDFNDFYFDYIREITPFLLERKYCYNTPDTRDGTSQSFYNFIQHPVKPNIETEYEGNFIQPDTSLKELVNSFTQYILDKLQPLQTESTLLQTSISNSQNFVELKNEKRKNINKLNEELNSLNNNNYRNKRYYQNSHFSFNYYKFCINLVINSILFLTTIFCIFYLSKDEYSLLSPKIGFYLNLVIIVIFALYLILNLNTAELRNKSNWNQIRFKTMSNTADTV